MNIEELDNYLVKVAEYHESEVEQMSPKEKLDAYVRYEGIIGFTPHIWDTCAHCLGVISEDECVDDLNHKIILEQEEYAQIEETIERLMNK